MVEDIHERQPEPDSQTPDPRVPDRELVKRDVQRVLQKCRRAECVPNIITPPPGPKARAVIERTKAVVTPSHTTVYPLVLDHGDGCYVWDVDGNCYLDFCAGILCNTLGHNHVNVNTAIEKQNGKITHISQSDLYHEPYVALCERLTQIAPGHSLKKAYLCNSGAEAVEAGLKLARFVTQRDRFIGFKRAFHGRTFGALSFTSSNAAQRRGYGRQVLDVHRIPYPDVFRDTEVDRILFDLEESFGTDLPPQDVAAVLFEPIQGEGGYRIPPKRFVERLRRLCTEHGILLIADEVQTGNGRTGKHFCMEHYNVEPDILVTAKGIANGLPLGAMIARKALIDQWGKGSHTSTFGGNPVACAAALAVSLELENGVLQNCIRMGEYLLRKLTDLKNQHPMIGDVRGKGLMIGVELVKPWTKEYAVKERDRLVQRAFENGLILLGCGPSAVRITPPLIINQREADIGVEIIDKIVSEIERA